jgi:GTP diphosphokinase / guanosine-3',5'-bis(diphosphate) 3'-diphosphatase
MFLKYIINEMSQLLEKLTGLTENFYNEEQLNFSKELFNEINNLKLDDNSKIIGFFLSSDLKNEKIKQSIEESFGKGCIKDIELLKRLGNISFQVGEKNIFALRKSFIELADDIRIIIIKLTERLVSLRFSDRTKKDDIIQLSEECLYFYSPIAQMLGIRKIYNEMEDISFKNLFPNDFEFLQKKISEKEPLYNSKLSTIRNEINKFLIENKIPARLQSRIKRPFSVYRKLKNKKITLDSIFDLLALRIITDSIENCYRTLGIVHSKWVPIEGRFRDWISYPKPNGYRSIQTTVYTRKGDKFEIQIRTEEMHEEAEYGSSAHWAYKQKTQTNEIQWIQNLTDFLENDEYFENPFQFFEKLKSDIIREHINVLSPKGDIISLPVGSTPIDFAFSVHTDLGFHTIGAKVNNKFIKLKTELKSGDIVDIVSNPSATPSRDWLTVVKTARAKSKILRWFKQNERDIYITQGKNAWEKLKEQYRKKIAKFEDEKKFKHNLALIGYKTYDDFYYAISNGAVKCSLYQLKRLYPDAFTGAKKEKKFTDNKFREDVLPVKVDGMDNIETIISKCCNPIKGDQIIAYITKKSTIKIHSKNCPYINSDSIDKNNLKKAEWLKSDSMQLIRCKMIGSDYSKILSQIVTFADDESLRIINNQKIIMKNGKEGIYLEIAVKDNSQFKRLEDKLTASSLVYSIRLV